MGLRTMIVSESEREALEHLAHDPAEPGAIDSEAVLRAHLTFLALVGRGLVSLIHGEHGPVYSITPAGRSALIEPTWN